MLEPQRAEDDGAAEARGDKSEKVGDDTGLATNTASPILSQSTASALASFRQEAAQENLRELKRKSSWKAGETDVSLNCMSRWDGMG